MRALRCAKTPATADRLATLQGVAVGGDVVGERSVSVPVFRTQSRTMFSRTNCCAKPRLVTPELELAENGKFGLLMV
jgi:hypothetical protein